MVATIYNLQFFAIIAAVFTNAIAASETVDYCNLSSCKQKRTVHTMCKYKSNSPASACGKYFKDRGLTDEEKAKIIEKHNKYRQLVASGQEPRGKPGPQPPAVHMPNVSWDNELALIAQRWADQCTFSHDQCRNVERFLVGQNIAEICRSRENNISPIEMIQLWYDEVSLMDKKQVENLTDINIVGHYTQIVCSATLKIGCGRITYRKQRWYCQLLVCNYGPSVNYFGGEVYEVKK